MAEIGQNRITNGINYTLFYKKVRNLNLRVRRDGSVALSAPRRCPVREADAFVASKAAWIARAQARMAAAETQDIVVDTIDRDEAAARFDEVVRRFYPYFSHRVSRVPDLLVRDMTSRWGVCHPAKQCITLNLKLAAYPPEALEYVVVHGVLGRGGARPARLESPPRAAAPPLTPPPPAARPAPYLFLIL